MESRVVLCSDGRPSDIELGGVALDLRGAEVKFGYVDFNDAKRLRCAPSAVREVWNGQGL